MVEQLDEGVVLLAVHLVELDGDVCCLCESLGAEEIGGVIVRIEQCFILRSHHGSKLLQVADHEQLNTAKGQVTVAETSQHCVYGIEQVTAHHGDLVDDEQVEGCDDAALVTAEVEFALDTGIWYEGGEGQLEKRVDGDTTCIDGCDTCRGNDNRPLARPLHHCFQKSGFSCSCLSCEKNAPACVFHKLPGGAQFFVVLHITLMFLTCKDTIFIQLPQDPIISSMQKEAMA